MTTAPRVLVVGDANLDLVLTGNVVPQFGQVEQVIDAAQLVLGGSAAIVACGLARLGIETSLVAVVGDDSFGAHTLEALTDAGVDVGSVEISPGTATGLSVILSAEDDRAILTLPGAVATLTVGSVRNALSRLDPEWVHFASPFLVPEIGKSIGDLATELRARSVGTSLDTNWDPSNEWAGILTALPSIDVLLPNRSELNALATRIDPTAGDRSAEILASMGPRVVVKDGAAGGWSLDSAGIRESAPGLPVEVVDTTGAGDSFDAGYIAALVHGVPSERDRLAWATTAGSLSTRARGGTAGQTMLAELLDTLG